MLIQWFEEVSMVLMTSSINMITIIIALCQINLLIKFFPFSVCFDLAVLCNSYIRYFTPDSCSIVWPVHVPCPAIDPGVVSPYRADIHHVSLGPSVCMGPNQYQCWDLVLAMRNVQLVTLFGVLTHLKIYGSIVWLVGSFNIITL